MRYIVFGNDGRNTLGQIRSLGVVGIRPIIILVGKCSGVCEASRYCGVVHHVDCEIEGIELLLNQYVDVTDKAIIYTDSDGVVGALNADYDRLSPYFFFSSAGEQGKLNRWLEKFEQLTLAEKVGFKIPQTFYWHSGDNLPSVHYPVFTKASSSLKDGWKQSSHICNNIDELRHILENCNINGDEKLLVQQLVNKKDELYFEGFSICGGSQIYIPLYGGYYRLQPTSYGTYEWLASYEHGDEFLGKLKALFQEVHYDGIFEVEFLLDDDNNLYFTEINFRETAFNHVHTLMGVNLTWMYAQSLEKGYLYTNEARVVKEPFVFMNEFTDFLLYVPKGKISLARWLKDVRHCDAYIFYNKYDKRPFYIELKNTIKYVFKSLFGKILKKSSV